jgi:hypothetical protein
MTTGQPPPIVATPASQYPELRGRRVIIGVPGIGFRGDLRADDAVINGSRTFVPVLSEQDYFRAEIDQVDMFAPLVPIDRVWVEHIAESTITGEAATVDAPPARNPIPVSASRNLVGLRLIQGVPDGYVRNLRAVTNVYQGAQGIDCVRVAHEPDWYRWAITGTTPATEETRAAALWVE